MENFSLDVFNTPSPLTNPSALYGIGYGLYIVTTRENGKDSGLVVNTVSQVGAHPDLIAVSVNNANHSCGVIARTGKLNVNILTEQAPFSLFQNFGFQSGKTADKMKGLLYGRSENNLPVLREFTNAYMSLEVVSTLTLPSHTLFFCTVGESATLSKEPSMSYAYYHANVKPKKPTPKDGEKKTGWICKICGYIHEEENLPDDFICPICKHPASDFEKL